MMKKFKKIGALILTLALLATSLMTGGIVYAEDTLPETNTTVDPVGSYSNWYAAYKMAFEKSGIEYIDAVNGFGRKTDAEAYLVFRAEKNSPFIANFKIFTDKTDGRPVFYVSSDGVNYTEYEMNCKITNTEVDVNGNIEYVAYYTNGIGENNKYVKILVSDTEKTNYRVDLRSLSYNANTEAEASMDTTLDFTNESKCNTLISNAFDSLNVTFYTDGLCGQNKDPNLNYIVYRVQDNSPFAAKLVRQENETWGYSHPIFYSSADGINWTKLTTTYTAIDTTTSYYYRDSIGAGNKYLKIVIRDGNTSMWMRRLQTLSYNANTEAEASMDTTLDFTTESKCNTSISNAYDSLNVTFYTDGLCGQNKDSNLNYIVYKVQDNSPFAATLFRQVDDSCGTSHPIFYSSADGINWTKLTTIYTAIDATTSHYYRDSIGAGNKYLKIVIRDGNASMWMRRLRTLSFNLFPITDTNLDCDANEAAMKNAAYTMSFDRAGIRDYLEGNGILGSDIPNSYVVYKVQDNSPIKLDFLWQLDGAKPLFYASSDGIAWNPITMDVFKNGQTHIYHIAGIGEGNRYVKIVISDTKPDSSWKCNLREVCYNANTVDTPENETFDNVLNYVGDYSTVFEPAIKKATTISNVNQNEAYGVKGTQGTESYLVYEVEKNSAIYAYFLTFDSYKPTFYASADNENWTKLAVESTKSGNNEYFYRDCIGAENKYVKIVLSETAGADYRSEMRSFSYNLVDPNGDGKVNAEDLVSVRRRLLGVEDVNLFDFNRDGKEDVRDLVALKKYLV